MSAAIFLRDVPHRSSCSIRRRSESVICVNLAIVVLRIFAWRNARRTHIQPETERHWQTYCAPPPGGRSPLYGFPTLIPPVRNPGILTEPPSLDRLTAPLPLPRGRIYFVKSPKKPKHIHVPNPFYK